MAAVSLRQRGRAAQRPPQDFSPFYVLRFCLCFASTCVATLYHYLFAREAPYPWWDLPVLLGTLGASAS